MDHDAFVRVVALRADLACADSGVNRPGSGWRGRSGRPRGGCRSASATLAWSSRPTGSIDRMLPIGPLPATIRSGVPAAWHLP